MKMKRLLALIAIGCAVLQTGSAGQARIDSIEPYLMGTTTSGTLMSSYSVTSYDLDKQPTVWCQGMDTKTNQPFGCTQGDDWSIPVTYNGKSYKVTRLDLRRAMDVLKLTPTPVKTTSR